MIDLHSHILPELDDGARSLRESLSMAQMALDSGITAMAATPHCMDGGAEETKEAFDLLKEALRDAGLPLKLTAGMEIFGTADTARLLQEGKLLTLNGSRYPLIEFSFHSAGEEETRILRSIRKAGYRPIVAHPERYGYVQRNPDLLNRWHKMGCLMQVNRGSLLGRFGHRAQDLAAEMVDRGFAAAVASDAHGFRRRTPWMEDVWELLYREVSPLCAQTLLKDNPRKILNNESIPPVEPEWFR